MKGFYPISYDDDSIGPRIKEFIDGIPTDPRFVIYHGKTSIVPVETFPISEMMDAAASQEDISDEELRKKFSNEFDRGLRDFIVKWRKYGKEMKLSDESLTNTILYFLRWEIKNTTGE